MKKDQSKGELSQTNESPQKTTFITTEQKKPAPGGGDKVDEAQVRKRQEQALMFEKYLEESGLSLSFQIIFTELIQKQIAEDQVFAYTAMRLRKIGKELE